MPKLKHVPEFCQSISSSLSTIPSLLPLPSLWFSLPPSPVDLFHRESQQHTFTIFRPKLSLSQLHPGEGEVKSVLTRELWDGLFGPEGRIAESDCVKMVKRNVAVYVRAIFRNCY